MYPIIVCGHMGGGTTVIARLLQTRFGVMMNFGPLVKDDVHPKGYYEEPVLVKMTKENHMRYLKERGPLVDNKWHNRFERYKRFMQKNYPQWGFKLPHLNTILHEVVRHFKYPPTFIRCKRDINKVKASQKKHQLNDFTDSQLDILYELNETHLNKFLKPYFHLTLDMTNFIPEKYLIKKMQSFFRAKSIMNPAFVQKVVQHEALKRWR